MKGEIMKQLINEWELHLTRKKVSQNTIRVYTEVARNCFRSTKINNYENSIDRYFGECIDLAPATINARVSILSSFQNWMIKEKKLDKDRKIDMSWKYAANRIKKNHVKIITPEEQEIMFDKGIKNTRDKLAATILLKTGIRISEFDYLDDIDKLLKQELIAVEGKSSMSREIYISKEIKSIAREFQIEHGSSKIWPSSYAARDKRIKAIATRAEIKLNLHMFRATFATEWVYHGHGLVQLQQAMGHASLGQLEPYIASNQLLLKRTWEEFSNGDNHHDRNFLRAENRMLKENNIKLKKEIKELKNG